MSLKTKAYGGFAVLAVAVAAAFYFYDPTLGHKDDYPVVIFKVTFTPNPRHEPVQIIIAGDGAVLVHEAGVESPWQDARPSKRGHVFTLTAVQKSGEGNLECTIVTPDQTVGPNPANLTPRPGTQACLAAITP